MRMPYLVHILAGSLALIFGYVALFAAKGGTVHRKSGMLFVYVILVMAITGAGMAALEGGDGSVIAGVIGRRSDVTGGRRSGHGSTCAAPVAHVLGAVDRGLLILFRPG